MKNEQPVLQMLEMVKTYPGVIVVDQASLELRRGEVHALVGENGAGKSTLIKIMAGLVQPDAGEMRLNGEPLTLHTGQDAFDSGLSFIHQELNLIPYLGAAENIFLGHPYPKNRIGTIDWKTLHQKAREILAQLGVTIPVDVPVSNLSRGDQSMISLARALAGDAIIYVMDEPTAALTDEEIHNLFAVIRSLRSRGFTILYVSHRLEEIFEICDRVTVMRDGRIVATHNINEITQAEMIRLMIGRKLTNHYPPATAEIGSPLMRVENLSGKNVDNISFTLHAGEVLGFAGLVGAGRTDILRMIFGADARAGGDIWLDGDPFAPKQPADAIKQAVLLVPEERRTEGLLLNHSILDNITLPHLKELSRYSFFLNISREREISQQAGEAVRLKASSLKQKVRQLSGGNQQKVVFARWMFGDTRVLLLDEPSRGVDVGARYEIYKIIRDLTSQGVGILLVSSDLNELLGLADRVIVMREGRQTAVLLNQDLSQETVLKYCYGEDS